MSPFATSPEPRAPGPMAAFAPSPRFIEALRRFDEANAQDPNRDSDNGCEHPREWLYAQRLSAWVLKLAPDASEPLRLAARCQHLRRWEIPRDTYPADRPGYLRWRKDLRQFHARHAAEILTAVGYEPETLNRVRSLNLKENLGKDPELQVLEDALCLVFLEFQFADLAGRSEEGKMVNAVRKSWGKMSAAGHAAALTLTYGNREQAILALALSSAEPTPEAPNR